MIRKVKTKLIKITLAFWLCFVLVFSVPLAVLAQEAPPVQEAPPEQQASPPVQEAPPDQEAAPATDDSSPSPSPVITTSEETVEYQPIDYWEGNDWDGNEEEWRDEEWVPREDSSGNVGDTSIDSGDALGSGSVITEANTTTVADNGNCTVCVDDVNVKNSGNGSGSDNSASVGIDSAQNTNINNAANIDSDLDIDANTGDNVASKNVGASTITTGDANVSGVVITSANETGLGVVEYNIVDDLTGDVILALPDGLFGCGLCGPTGDINVENSGNGEDSTNSAQVDVNNTTDTNIYNDANIVNNLDLTANSGYNETSNNTGGDSSITTGDANVAANLVNLVNSTITSGVAFVVNVFGDLVGDIIFPENLPGIGGTALSAVNLGNGAGSTNTADIDSINSQNTTINNLADIDNVIDIDANTGRNETNDNTGGANSIETGDVFVNAEVLNVVNTNLLGGSDEPLWLILVNNMGTWTGQIIGALTGTNYSGSSGFVFTVDDDGGIVAANQGNGADSTNTANVTTNNTNNLDINNTANITNNININANTGRNEANKNTGGDSTIKTGDVNVAASIINFVNSNFVGRTVMLGIINVFGSWTGDAVPPGFDPQAAGVNLNVSGSGGGNGNAGSGSNNSNSEGSVTLAVGGVNINGLGGSNGSSGTGGSSFGFGGFGGASGGSVEGLNTPTVTIDAGNNFASGAEGVGSGIINFRVNLKMFAFGLIPLIAFALLRTRMKLRVEKTQSAIAHEIKVRKSK